MVQHEGEFHEKDGLAIVHFASSSALEEWLGDHHHDTPGPGVKMAKKASGIPSVDWAQLVQVVLCFGWIDGQRKGYDDSYFVHRITPRRPAADAG